MVCDLSDTESIKQFAASFLALDLPLHCLICNAGVMATEYRLTKQGYDLQFGTNHVGHALLVWLLLEKLVQTAPSRVIVLSSDLHNGPAIDFSRLPSVPADKYSRWGAYQQSKLANALFAKELHRRFSARGVSAFSLHPGVITTELTREITCACCFHCCGKICMKSIPEGCATTIFCAAKPGLDQTHGGAYFFNSAPRAPNVNAQDDAAAQKLWEWTEKALKVEVASNGTLRSTNT